MSDILCLVGRCREYPQVRPLAQHPWHNHGKSFHLLDTYRSCETPNPCHCANAPGRMEALVATRQTSAPVTYALRMWLIWWMLLYWSTMEPCAGWQKRSSFLRDGKPRHSIIHILHCNSAHLTPFCFHHNHMSPSNLDESPSCASVLVVLCDQCIAERPDWIVVALCDKNTVRSEYYNKVLERARTYQSSHLQTRAIWGDARNQKVDTILVTTVDVTHHLYIIPALEARGMHSECTRPSSKPWARPARPKSWPDHCFGPAREFGKPKPSLRPQLLNKFFEPWWAVCEQFSKIISNHSQLVTIWELFPNWTVLFVVEWELKR